MTQREVLAVLAIVAGAWYFKRHAAGSSVGAKPNLALAQSSPGAPGGLVGTPTPVDAVGGNDAFSANGGALNSGNVYQPQTFGVDVAWPSAMFPGTHSATSSTGDPGGNAPRQSVL
jgi:hypothetical protein